MEVEAGDMHEIMSVPSMFGYEKFYAKDDDVGGRRGLGASKGREFVLCF